jgi:Uma2 family endonuclease
MGETARKKASYEDVLAAPQHKVAEVVAGALYVHPRLAGPHALVTSVLGEELGGPFRSGRGGPGGWIFLDEPELHLGSDIVVPDLAAWRRARLPAVPNEAYLTVVPDWICEALSPSTARFDRVDKLAVYAREGVSHVWFIDPLQRTLEILRLDSSRWQLSGSYRDDARVRAEPFDAIELDLAVLWADIAKTDE